MLLSGSNKAAKCISETQVSAWQFEQAMQEMKISKTELARRMHTRRAGIDRLLNVHHTANDGKSRQRRPPPPHFRTQAVVNTLL